MHWAFRNRNYGVSMTTITIVDSLWRHNDNCCYANMRSQGQASCLLTLEFKCHLRYCSSQEVDVSLSHSAVFHYISEFVTLGLSQHVWPPAQDHARNSKALGSQKSVVLSTFHDAATCASSRAHWPSCTTSGNFRRLPNNNKRHSGALFTGFLQQGVKPFVYSYKFLYFGEISIISYIELKFPIIPIKSGNLKKNWMFDFDT